MQYIPPDNFDVMHKIFKAYNVLQLQRGCEVGVRYGVFSEYLLNHNPNLDMILVDPYMPYDDHTHIYTEEEQLEIKHDAFNLLDVFNHRAKWSYLPSTRAVTCFDDEFFDFVFIDAHHTYENVKADISLWWKKVRLGGLLSGHDYSMQEVSTALKDWMFENKLTTLFRSPLDQADCWWIVRI